MDNNLFLRSALTGIIVWRLWCWYDQEPANVKMHMLGGLTAAGLVYYTAAKVPGVTQVSNLVFTPSPTAQ